MISVTKSLSAPILDVVVTARPSWARVKSLVSNYALVTHPSRIRVLFVGPAVSKRYGDVTSQIPHDIEFETMLTLNESDGLDAVTQSCISGAQQLTHRWSTKRPDCALVIADRTETLGAAMAASVMQIPLIHLQGGEISGSIDDKIRDANSKLADLHLTTNNVTGRRLQSLGEDKEIIFPIGCPSIDLVKNVIENPMQFRLFSYASDFGGVGGDFSISSTFGIVMFHPDTLNESDNSEWVKNLIEIVDDSPVNWFWFWPNPDHGSHFVSHLIRQARESNRLSNVRFVINLPPEQFVFLASRSNLMVGNSSFGIRESTFLGLPVVNIGGRQSGRQKSNNVRDLPKFTSQSEFKTAIYNMSQVGRFPASNMYGDGSAGMRGALIIANWKPSLKLRKN